MNSAVRKPLRVVIPVDTFPPDINGAARFAERLAGGLARRGHDVHIIAPAYSREHGSFKEVHDGALMTVHRIKSHKLPQHANLRWVNPIGMTRKIRQIISILQPDAVHIQSHVMIGRYAIKAARAAGIYVMATNHFMPENLIRYSVIIPKFLWGISMKLAWRDSARVLKQVAVVTTPTRRAAELLEAATGITGVLAISCGIDASKFENSAPPSNADPRILFLGRLDYEKQIHNLIRALALLPKDLNAIVELVGDGSERHRLEDLAFELGVREQVIFSGHISEAELPRAYERATVFAMPSIAELQSIATMEAMASGRPVVAADAMALPHLVHDGDNGYLFPPDDVEVFADRLKRVLTASPEELERLSENSLHLIRAHDINRTLDIFEGLYRGESEEQPQTADNAEEYSKPIGRLNESLHEQIVSFRKAQSELRDRTATVRQRIFGLGEEAAKNIGDTAKNIGDTVKKAADRLKRD